MTKFRRTFKSGNPAQEFKEAKRAAKVLGFKPTRFGFSGSWEDDDGRAFFPPAGDMNVRKVGNKYFYVPGDDRNDTIPIKPTTGPSGRGEVTVTFSDQ